MLSKCANPDCTAAFRYLSHGKLFRLDTTSGNSIPDAFGMDPTAKKPARHIEFFWLCEDCADTVTLAFKKGEGITMQPVAQAKAAASSS
jgi:hypothetical protein